MNLRGRLILGCALIVAVITAVAVVSHRTLEDLADESRLSRHSVEVLSTAGEALRAATQAQTAFRGALSTGDPGQIRDYRRRLPAVELAATRLEQVTKDDAAQHARAVAFHAQVTRYITLQRRTLDRGIVTGLPLSTEKLRARFALGSLSIAGLERRYAALAAVERRVGDARDARTAHREHRTSLVIVLGAVLTALLLVACAAYLLRFVGRPLATAADAAGEVAAGRRGVVLRVRDRIPEVRRLAAAFNTMSAGLDDRQDELERRRDELEQRNAALSDKQAELEASLESLDEERRRTASDAARRSAITATSQDAFVAADDLGRIVDWNPQAQRLWGWTAPEAAGMPFADLCASSDTYDELIVTLRDQQDVHGRATMRMRTTARNHDGGTFPVEMSASITRVEGHPMLFVFARDVTEIERAERLKDEFFALVSHELRTPLTSIIGYLETVREDPDLDDATRGHFLAVVERNAQRLQRLVGDILFATQTGTGKVRLVLTPVNAERVISGSVVAAKPAAEARGIDLNVAVAPLPPIDGDPDRLGQLLDNLLSNALKFSPPDSTVEVRASSDDHVVFIEVQDHGIGIPDEDQDQLFDRFFRARNAAENAVQGVGLGLNICRAIARGHGGDLTFRSVEGVGTTFTLTLPAKTAN